jgi:amino acid transporter
MKRYLSLPSWGGGEPRVVMDAVGRGARRGEAAMSFSAVRRLLVGQPLATAHAIHQRLPKYLAVSVFGSDPISSSAYATEEILLALVLAGSLGLRYAAGVALAIAALFVIVSISYRQTVTAYPSGGGAYVVARENLGTYPGLVAAAALLTDYVLTVAVSVSAGVAAVVSAAPALAPYRVVFGVLLVAFIAVANLRGVRESGTLFAPPVYLFVGIVLLMLGLGAYRLATGTAAAAAVAPPAAVAQGVTLVLLLRAFASGCAALTGIEAISNGVQAFRPPESRNAAITLLWMVGVCLTLFVGITFLAQAFHIVPDERGRQTVLSMLGHTVFGEGILYLVLQVATAGILVLAANTAFADFPRLSSILARDGFAPRQLANLGDRLVFANGIILLGGLASVLIVLFRGSTHLLIPLYAVGVFVSFTLSQAGMVVHWRRLRGAAWRTKAAVSAVGAAATGVVLMVVGSVKFVHGAFLVLLFIPILVLVFSRIARHYHSLREALEMRDQERVRALRLAVLVPVRGVDRSTLQAVAYAKTISPDPEAVYVETDPEDTRRVREAWDRASPGVPLTVLASAEQSVVAPVVCYARARRAETHADLVTIVIPETIGTHWWQRMLQDQGGLLLKLALLSEPSIAVANVRS